VRTLRQLFYLSRAAATLTDLEVRQILQISQRNNRRKDITGCLLYTGRHFAQVLEGEPALLDELVDRIARDTRHSDFVVAIDHQVSIRRFPDWSMGILYKSDTADRIEGLLVSGRPSEERALELLGEMHPDTLMGAL
jgi:Sensors of blue-light using FAD